MSNHEKYWKHYTGLQKAKHDLIRNYLNGWIPKLGYTESKILYVDTHAGRGFYDTGEAGSPIVALETLRSHSHAERILTNTEMHFYYIEADTDNAKLLEREVSEFGSISDNVHVRVITGDAFELVGELLNELDKTKKALAPAFFFIDPFGFKIPGSMLRDLMKLPRVELFVNIMWRELNMGIGHGLEKKGMATTLDTVFGGDRWREIAELQDANERAQKSIVALRELTDAKWATYIRMLGKNGATRYLLLHLTNHDQGRDLMKDCAWKICPTGGFYARMHDDPRQEQLLTPKPDLKPLRESLIAYIQRKPVRWTKILEEYRPYIWRSPQVNSIISDLRKRGIIEADGFEGRFCPKNDPRLRMKGSAET